MSVHVVVDETRGRLAVTVIDPCGTDPDADLVEIRVEDGTSTVRLSKVETELLGLLLSRLVDDFNARGRPVTSAETAQPEGRSMTRDALLKALLPLPREAEIDVQIGAEHLALTGLGPAWEPAEGWFALQCHPSDVVSLLALERHRFSA
ncbi:hypothetical protein [Jidongwangia harbinensis]|uniref:hypothetical protein n=1 Tax=Jidongwangia harbinensis TaxID=2878561 RepID=UPI001CD9A687|nr:hypothetical protein [Jidongwangia harbinensis]MCA2219125.1 hypothetical protein [Jidongwangia harbinensis]